VTVKIKEVNAICKSLEKDAKDLEIRK